MQFFPFTGKGAGIALALVLAGASSLVQADGGRRAFAHDAQQTTLWAPVVNVQPVYREVRVREPRQQCWYENGSTVYHRDRSSRRRSDGREVAGALVGGVLGNQIGRHFGGKDSRAVGTIAGALVGSAVVSESRRADRRERQDAREVRRCREVLDVRLERQIDYYRVRYRYRGNIYTTRTRSHPGSRIELAVELRPKR